MRCSFRASLATSAQLQGHLADTKLGLLGPRRKRVHGVRFVELGDRAAVIANGEHSRAPVTGMAAGDKRVE